MMRNTSRLSRSDFPGESTCDGCQLHTMDNNLMLNAALFLKRWAFLSIYCLWSLCQYLSKTILCALKIFKTASLLIWINEMELSLLTNR